MEKKFDPSRMKIHLIPMGPERISFIVRARKIL